MDHFNLPPRETPQEVADQVARRFFGVTDDASWRRTIRNSLISIVWFTALIPLAFYLRFGYIGPLGWGTTVAFDTYALLTAIALYFRPRTEYHSPVALRGDWLDHIGAFWLVTLLSVSSAMNVSRDLWEGPMVRESTGQAELFLQHTGRSLGTQR